MRPSKVNINNYEAFLLDRMEGTISTKDAELLDLFLKQHPELDDSVMDGEFFGQLNEGNDISQMFLMSEDLKKQEPSESEIDILIDVVEGVADVNTLHNVQTWVVEDDILRRHFTALELTRLKPDLDIKYEFKPALKRTVPAFRPMAWMAAAVFIGIVILAGVFYNIGVEVDSSFPMAVDLPIEKNINHGIDALSNIPATPSQSNVPDISFPTAPETGSMGQVREGMVTRNKDYPSTPIIQMKLPQEVVNPDAIALVEENLPGKQQYVNHLPRLAQYSSAGVASSQLTTTLYRIQNGKLESQIQPPSDWMTMARGLVKSRAEMLNRTTESLKDFADAQLTAIEKEGLIGISPEHKADGRLDGFALRIAGIEFTNERY